MSFLTNESSVSWNYVYLGHQASLGLAASDTWHYATPCYPGLIGMHCDAIELKDEKKALIDNLHNSVKIVNHQGTNYAFSLLFLTLINLCLLSE